MIPANELALFALAALVMVLTPGPNMIYLVSRSLSQGRAARVRRIALAGHRVSRLARVAGVQAGRFVAVPAG
jgi:threonine/homoserine/homoserine lactone efflux protein